MARECGGISATCETWLCYAVEMLFVAVLCVPKITKKNLAFET